MMILGSSIKSLNLRKESKFYLEQAVKRMSHRPSVQKINLLQKQIFETGIRKTENQALIRLRERESLVNDGDPKYMTEVDSQFISDVDRIAKGHSNVLSALVNDDNKDELTELDCDEIDFKARLHYKANIVNSNSDNNFEEIPETLRCHCGCLRGKGQPLGLCCDEQQLNVLGSGVVLLFMFKRTFAIILASAIAIYGIFALATNLVGESATSDEECSDDLYCEFRTNASSENKLEPSVYTVAQWWVGVGFCLVWIFILRFIKYFAKKKDQTIDKFLNSSSDYAVMIENLPYGDYNESEMVAYFDLLYDRRRENRLNRRLQKGTREQQQQQENPRNGQSEASDQSSEHQIEETLNNKNKFHMKSFQIIYNMEFGRVVIGKIVDLALQIKEMYSKKHPNKVSHQKAERYLELKGEICRTFELLADLRKKFLFDENFRRQLSTTVALIEFERESDKDHFLKEFGNTRIGILKEVQEKIKGWFSSVKQCVMFRGSVLKIERAPEPSDLLFRNCEKRFKFSRIVLIYAITLAIILGSFLVLTLLTVIQERLRAEGAESSGEQSSSEQSTGEQSTADPDSDTTTTVLNVVISLSLQAVNSILWFALYYILDLEHNHTLTQKIISQMNKVLVSTSINIIALPIISNFVIRNNVYGSEGLAGMVFDYQVSLLTVGLVVKLLDPAHFLRRALLHVRCLRNFLIRRVCDQIVQVSPTQGVPEVNRLYEAGFLDIAEIYVYIMAATYQAAFFCQLQPALLILITLTVIAFYWVNKFKVLRTCKIPEITEILVFETALSQAALVPIVYGGGSIVLSYIEASYNPNLPLNYLPGFVSIAIGVVGFFNPKDFLNKIVFWMMERFFDNSREENPHEDDQKEDSNYQNSGMGLMQPDISDEISEASNAEEESEGQILNRLDNYFKDSNALSLLGFEYSLMGTKEPEAVVQELEASCKKYFDQKKAVRARSASDQNQQIGTQKSLSYGRLFKRKASTELRNSITNSLNNKIASDKDLSSAMFRRDSSSPTPKDQPQVRGKQQNRLPPIHLKK